MRARVPTPRESRPSRNDQAMNLPRPYKLRRFYTPKEVALHNISGDCWVSIFDKVYDLTLLINKNHTRPECDPIVLAAGTDITHWFDPATQKVSALSLYINQTDLSVFLVYSLAKELTLRRVLKSICAHKVDSCTSHLRIPIANGIPTSLSLGGKTRPGTASETSPSAQDLFVL